MRAFLALFIAIVISSDFVSGQERTDTSGALVNQLIRYGNHHLQEKLFVHIDRSLYLTGETIWLRLYYVDGSFHRPLNVSKVAYLEVLDTHHKAVVQGKIALNDEGSGNGTLFLPASIGSGYYTVRAYTNWMKNFSPELYFQQQITVVNPFAHVIPGPKINPVNYDVQFFPEGGNLVNGLKSVVGFRAVDQTGRGIDFRGVIFNERNDTITNISPLKFGIGRFTFTPFKGHEYRAIIIDSNRKRAAYKLPSAVDEGIVLHVSETPDKIKIGVNAIIKTDHPVVHLLAHTRQGIMVYHTQSLQNGEGVFMIDKNVLGEGISHITIFNENLIPVCERLVFTKPIQELTIDVRSESNYACRKKVNIHIRTSLAGKMDTTANLSASIVKVDSLGESGQNIVNYLLLTSDLKGNIESPGYYFERESTQERREASDNLMLTHGWIRFKWQDIFQGDHPAEYIPEYHGHVITGRIKEASTRVPASGVLTYLSLTGLHTRPALSRSNDQGKLFFEMQGFYGRNDLIVQTNTQVDSVYKVEVDDPFSEKKSTYPAAEIDLRDEIGETIAQRSIHMQVGNAFYKNGMSVVKKIRWDSAAFYGPPDEKYNLDDYTRFPTMEEVMREYVRGVQVRKHKDGFHFMNFDWVNKAIFAKDPFVMVDGIPVFDIDRIISFDPRQVKSVEVMNRKYYLGVSAFDGIVSYRTYTGDLGGFQPDVKSLITSYDGLQSQREFFSPQYETPLQQESTIPDTRNLLYWSPSVTTDHEGNARINFYTSDISGKYRVVIQGITKEGIPGYSSTTFQVKGRDK
jgi:hypothetical protein